MKESKSGFHRDIGVFIKPVKNFSEGMDLVMNSLKANALISSRSHLAFITSQFDKKLYYIPPETDESILNIDIMAIAVNKEFEFKNQFNYLWVYSKFS